MRLSFCSFFLLLVLLFNLLACLKSNKKNIYLADPDYPSSDSNIGVAQQQLSTQYALSGKQSVCLSKRQPYGLTIGIADAKPGEVFIATLFRWRRNPHVRLAVQGDKQGYREEAQACRQVGDWDVLQIFISIKDTAATQKLQFFAYLTAGDSTYVDSLVVERYEERPLILPEFAYLRLTQDLLQHYSIIELEAPTRAAIEIFAQSEEGKMILEHHGLDYAYWMKSHENYKNTWTDESVFWAKLHQYKNSIKNQQAPSLREPRMRVYPVAAYSQDIVYGQGDSLKLKVQCQGLQSYVLQVEQIIAPYTYQKLERYAYQSQDTTLIFPLKTYADGFYRLRLMSRNDTFDCPLIVHAPKQAEVIILLPNTTYHAYNMYGGQSFYRNALDENPVYTLSAERPLSSVDFDSIFLGHDIHVLYNLYQWFSKRYETLMLPDYYLERFPERFSSAKVLVLAQHAEYFSAQMYKELKSLCLTRKFLALGGNQIYWKVRWSSDFKELECRKDGTYFSNSNFVGGLWASAWTNEAAFLGVAFDDRGYATYEPYRVVNADHFLLKGTGLSNGSTFGHRGLDGRGLSGDEMDKRNFASPTETQLLAQGLNPNNGGGEMVYLPGKHKNQAIFACGSIACASGVGIDSAFTQIILNFLEH